MDQGIDELVVWVTKDSEDHWLYSKGHIVTETFFLGCQKPMHGAILTEGRENLVHGGKKELKDWKIPKSEIIHIFINSNGIQGVAEIEAIPYW